MKRTLLCFIGLISVFIFANVPTASATYVKKEDVHMKLNEAYVIYSHQTMPYVDERDRTLVPLRLVADLLKGAETSWNESKQEVTITFNGLRL
ncbi:stalk domain-containing protein [Aureibacillus halotolerans]|uniref:Copper amine oxidase-like protein n=1 Tax=Aureibacillus halotolerans TaxID=1508390 RepID=A0A4R6U803_9BACI|nr:stalk domain-containing protein [Aureibacillus halotolerans]TDQ42658.1 copper amine oxidase-like protein [Aureibacillus halotolerans]